MIIEHSGNIPIPCSAQYDWLILLFTMVAVVRGDVKSKVMWIHSIQSLLTLIPVHHFYKCSSFL